jgi:hypothetical protein
MNFQLNYLPSYTERILMKTKEIKALKEAAIEIKAMFLKCKEIQEDLNQTSVGIAGNEMRDASRHLDMAIAFIQEALEDSSED